MSLDCFSECCNCCPSFACVVLYDEFCGENCAPADSGTWCANCGYPVCLMVTCPPPNDINCVPGFPVLDCDGVSVTCPPSGLIECPTPECSGTLSCNGDGSATVNLTAGAEAVIYVQTHDVWTCYYTSGDGSKGGPACCGNEGTGELMVNGTLSGYGPVEVFNGDQIKIWNHFTMMGGPGCTHDRYVACEGYVAFLGSVYKWIRGVLRLDPVAATNYVKHTQNIERQRRLFKPRAVAKRKPCGCNKKKFL